MIDLTPLDVRRKKNDLKVGMRGYDRRQVDTFLDLVADRLGQLLQENDALSQEIGQVRARLEEYDQREQAQYEALMIAQQLREESRVQAERDAAEIVKAARAHASAVESGAREAFRRASQRYADMGYRRDDFLDGLQSALRRFQSLLTTTRRELEDDPSDLKEFVNAAREVSEGVDVVGERFQAAADDASGEGEELGEPEEPKAPTESASS